MPKTEVVLFVEEDGSCPLMVWLDGLPEKVQDKCIVRIERLGSLGHEIRRPEADYLCDGIYELRVAFRSTQYRMLYFYNEQTVVISHGLIKEREIPQKDIDIAIKHKQQYRENPKKHTCRG